MKRLLLMCLLVVVLAVPCIVLSSDLPDTGLTKCYDDTRLNEINPCPKQGEDFYGQDANYVCNPQSYTKLDANGNDLPDTATSWVMVKDNVTGLIWESKTIDSSIHNEEDRYNWYDAQDVFIATLNAQNFGGWSDWRLPTIKELSFIIDNSIPARGPTINTTYFPYTLNSYYYWSSTTVAGASGAAWRVGFIVGYVFYDDKATNNYVRAVRGEQTKPGVNYIDNGNRTITDTNTGLMWQQNTTPDEYRWEQALAYCEDLVLGGYRDWRLPNRNELHSIVDYDRTTPPRDPDFSGIGTWSSTTSATRADEACDFSSYSGGRWSNKRGTYKVRAVRGGSCSSSQPPEPCPIKLVYGDHSNQTKLLRSFRDNILNKTPEGQELIKLYYQWSPVIVKAMEADEEFKVEIKELFDEILPIKN